MSIFTSITPEQIEKRYDILPDNMVDVLQSSSTKSSVDGIALEYGMVGNEITLFEILISYVFMGFIHPDRVVEELTDFFEIPGDKAKEISLKLNAQVFSLYRSDIEKVYFPLEEAPKPAPLPSTATGPTLNLKPLSPAPFAPTNLPTANTPVASAAAPFAPVSPIKTASPTAAAAPKPFVMHKETSGEQVVASSGFRLNLEPKAPAFRSSSSSLAPAPAPRAAKLELGMEAKKEPVGAVTIQGSSQRVVHYSDLRSSTSNPIPSGIKAAPVAAPAPALRPEVISPAAPLIRNSPGVPPTIKISTAAPSGNSSPQPQEAKSAVTPIYTPPKNPPKVVNFTAEGGNEVK